MKTPILLQDFKDYPSGRVRHWHVFGRNADVDTGTLPEDVFSNGGAFSWRTTAATTTVVSASTSDGTARTGARTVVLEGVDASFVEQVVTLNLTGATAVSSSVDFMMLNQVRVATAGSVGSNIGALTLKIGGTTTDTVEALHGSTMRALFTVPLGKTAFLTGWNARLTKHVASQSVELSLQIKEYGGAWRTVAIGGVTASAASTFIETFVSPFVLPAKTQVRVRCFTSVVDNAAIAASFDLLVLSHS